jgi:hypothetical protein
VTLLFVDPAATTRQGPPYCFVDETGAKDEKIIWKNQVYETGTDIFNFPEGTSAVQIKGQSLDKNYL